MSVVAGLVLLALGALAVFYWLGAVLVLAKAMVALGLLLVGFTTLIYGLAELRVGRARTKGEVMRIPADDRGD